MGSLRHKPNSFSLYKTLGLIHRKYKLALKMLRENLLISVCYTIKGLTFLDSLPGEPDLEKMAHFNLFCH